MLTSGVYIRLLNCFYSLEMTRNIISFYALFEYGLCFSFDNNNGNILDYKNGCLCFKASPCNSIYENVVSVNKNDNIILNVDSFESVLDKLCFWHCCLGHITKIQSDKILESFDLKSDDVYKSCLLGKITKSPFTSSCERGNNLLDLIYTDMYRPFKSTIRHGEQDFVAFNDDFIRHDYIYLTNISQKLLKCSKSFKTK